MSSDGREMKQDSGDKLHPVTVMRLAEIRRANAGIQACANILTQHSVNKDCLADTPGVHIQLDAYDEIGLCFAIEAARRLVANTLEDHFEDEYGVGFVDDYLPEVTREATAVAAYTNGEISWDECCKQSGLKPD